MMNTCAEFAYAHNCDASQTKKRDGKYFILERGKSELAGYLYSRR